MPAIRSCKQCGQKNRVAANHLSDTGLCGACKTPLPPVDEPLQVDAALFDEIVQNSRVPVLVDFWAEWCDLVMLRLQRSRAQRRIWLGMQSY
jgi:thioredoxin 2